jgi:hypothetical protein
VLAGIPIYLVWKLLTKAPAPESTASTTAK